jgi:hypothetical protein
MGFELAVHHSFPVDIHDCGDVRMAHHLLLHPLLLFPQHQASCGTYGGKCASPTAG